MLAELETIVTPPPAESVTVPDSKPRAPRTTRESRHTGKAKGRPRKENPVRAAAKRELANLFAEYQGLLEAQYLAPLTEVQKMRLAILRDTLLCAEYRKQAMGLKARPREELPGTYREPIYILGAIDNEQTREDFAAYRLAGFRLPDKARHVHRDYALANNLREYVPTESEHNNTLIAVKWAGKTRNGTKPRALPITTNLRVTRMQARYHAAAYPTDTPAAYNPAATTVIGHNSIRAYVAFHHGTVLKGKPGTIIDSGIVENDAPKYKRVCYGQWSKRAAVSAQRAAGRGAIARPTAAYRGKRAEFSPRFTPASAPILPDTAVIAAARDSYLASYPALAAALACSPVWFAEQAFTAAALCGSFSPYRKGFGNISPAHGTYKPAQTIGVDVFRALCVKRGSVIHATSAADNRGAIPAEGFALAVIRAYLTKTPIRLRKDKQARKLTAKRALKLLRGDNTASAYVDSAFPVSPITWRAMGVPRGAILTRKPRALASIPYRFAHAARSMRQSS